AFAVGRSPKSATVCATTGILNLLSPGELEAVLGHELTHVQNRDVVVMTIASFFASIAAFITQVGFWFGGAFDNRDQNSGPAFIVVILVSAVSTCSPGCCCRRYRATASSRPTGARRS